MHAPCLDKWRTSTFTQDKVQREINDTYTSDKKRNDAVRSVTNVRGVKEQGGSEIMQAIR